MNPYSTRTKRVKTKRAPLSYQDAKNKFEKEYLKELLRWSKGNVRLAAQKAKRDRKGLYVLLKKHNIDPNNFRMRKRKVRT